MQGRKTRRVVALTAEQRAEREHGQRSPTVPAGLARRGRLLWRMDQGSSLTQAARVAALTVRHARTWVRRFRERGTVGLADRPRPGRQPVFSPPGRPPPGPERLRATR